MNVNKKIIPKILIAFFIFASFITFIGVKAWLDTDPNEVIPPDSFIRAGQVITIIEEDERYFYKVENFSNDGKYTTPAMETQISYEEYAQIRSNGDYDILEKRNRHIIDDVYVDEYYRAYSDGEVMAGNYVAEVLDGYFVPVELYPFKETQRVLINDGGIYYLATYHFDKDYNYTKAASYMLMSENQYNEHIIACDYDYVKDVKWEISYDGNTITKTISYFDRANALLARPIILQMTGFEDLDGFIDDTTETSSTSSSTDSSTSTDTTTDTSTSTDSSTESSSSESSTSTTESTSTDSMSEISSIISSAISSAIDEVIEELEKEDEEEWLGTLVEFANGEPLFPWEAEWEDVPGQGADGDFSEEPIVEVEGFYDDAGNFIPVDEEGNILPKEEGYFDENGNFTAAGSEGYFDPEGIYHPEDEDGGEFDEDGNFDDGENKFDEDGNIIEDSEVGEENGYYDGEGNFIQDSGEIIDEEGVIHKQTLDTLLLDENGRKYLPPKGYLTLNELGQIVVFGYEDCYYDENGLAHLDDGKVGYYDKNGAFIETRKITEESGFYDAIGGWHEFTEIYKTENNSTQLVTYPEIIISTDGVSISVGGSSFSYTYDGLVINGIHKGYFNGDGEFIKSDKSAYKGGFFDSLGRWIDDSLFHKTSTNEIKLSYAYYDCYGVFTSPNNDKGYFNSSGQFIINRENPYEKGFYYFDKDFCSYGEIYIDAVGSVHRTGTDEIITADGQIARATSQKGTLDKNGYFFNKGIVITPDGRIGHYNEFKAFKEGQVPYLYGYYDANGYFFRYDGIIISPDGTVGYFDENGIWIEGVQGAVLDENGNWVLPDGTVITPDGLIGYYDENGVFHEGENPYSEIIVDDGSYIDSNGNLVLPDGTVITPDGIVGYYDENGNFIEGEAPWTDGYYDENGVWHSYDEEGEVIMPDGAYIDENGNTVLPDGTVITPDGVVGYYDENGVFHEGENPYEGGYYDENGNWIPYEEVPGAYVDENGNIVLPDGTVITPDGVVGYYDENGVFHEGESPYEGGYYDENGNWIADAELVEGAYIDENGNMVLPDGTVILPDGTVGYYDENGVFHEGESPYVGGYYDENGVWHAYEDEGVLDENGNIILADGTVVTPDGTIGYYDENGVFHEGESPYVGGYYDAEGNWIPYGEEVLLEDGTVILPDGTVGYYDENGVFHEGESPYEGGYYDENGNWIPYEVEEVEGYYDENGVWHEGTMVGYIDENGNLVLPNGVVMSPDGVAGYYDENGVFHEGESPYEGGYYDENGIWHSNAELGEGAYIDENGNMVLADGTVITPDGKVGYYDENGVFHEGESPYEGGYYDENGNWIADGYYDAEGNYIMSDGTIVTPDGTVILPDGTVVSGYLDEDGNLVLTSPTGTSYYDSEGNVIEGVNPDELGAYDAEGNYYLAGDDGYYDENGTYHAADGTIGYYDANGVFHEGEANPYVNGFYDENGVWHGDDAMQEVQGYYDANGVFHEGENPYTDGYYDENGVWHDTSELGVVDENGNTILPNGVVMTPDGLVGYYDENGIFHQGESPYTDGYYDAEGNWHELGATAGVTDGSYIDANGNTVLADGTVITPDGTVGYYDANGVFHEGESPYTDGYYDADGVWHAYDEEGVLDKNGNIVLADGTVITPDGVKGYYDANGVFHEGENPYENGYYDADGNFHSYEEGTSGEGAYIDENGNLVLPDGTILDSSGKVVGVMGEVSYDSSAPLVGYYDENGNYIVGEANPYEGGYYDKDGNWHSTTGEEEMWIDKEGNVHVPKDALGYYDEDGNFHMMGDDGYYDPNGTYHAADGTIGYYDADGVFHEGELNPYEGGYYDSEGNWHPEGEEGYYDAEGNWHESVSNTVVGYYDENGVFHEGNNPYKNGYYDENGVWHGDGLPESYYYDAEGNLIQGVNPNQEGWYDSNGNFHPYGEDGYFTANGTYHGKDGSVGYYDADGIFHEGTNPYINGYYDAEGNFHPFGEDGYYDANGTYHTADGKIGYYDADGVFHEGKENPYKDGWYDEYGNFHPFNADGYYDKYGTWHDNFISSDVYKYGSDDYVLFTGRWRSAAENAMLKLAGKTVQFTINKASVNSIYVDTGVYVALHSILEFEEAKDILHSIAVATGNVFIQDNDSCMIIYNGKSLTIRKDEIITVKGIRDLFENTNIDVTVAKTRIGRKYALVEAIESGADIKLQFDEKVITPKNPLVVVDNEAYVSLKDVSQLIFYDCAMKPNGTERRLTFTIKSQIPFEELRKFYPNTIVMNTGSGTINYIYTNGYVKYEKLDNLTPLVIRLDNGSTGTYIPLKLITRLTGCNASYETSTRIINLDYTGGIKFMETYYDYSNNLTGVTSITNNGLKDDKIE